MILELDEKERQLLIQIIEYFGEYFENGEEDEATMLFNLQERMKKKDKK